MNLLSRDDILGADDRRYEVVEVPEWGGAVRLRSLTGAERDEWEASIVVQKGAKTTANLRNMRAKLVALSACDADGLPLFSAADVIKLSGKNAAALDRLFAACQRLSGLTDEDLAELEGNSGPAPSGPSTSGSPPISDAPSASSSPASAAGSSPSGWPTNGSTGPSAHPAVTTTPR